MGWRLPLVVLTRELDARCALGEAVALEEAGREAEREAEREIWMKEAARVEDERVEGERMRWRERKEREREAREKGRGRERNDIS